MGMRHIIDEFVGSKSRYAPVLGDQAGARRSLDLGQGIQIVFIHQWGKYRRAEAGGRHQPYSFGKGFGDDRHAVN